METNDTQETGLFIGIAIIAITVGVGLFAYSVDDIVKPHKGLKWIILGFHTQALGILCLISHYFYNKSFIFRLWRKMTISGFILNFKNVHYFHFLIFFLAGSYVLFIGLGLINT